MHGNRHVTTRCPQDARQVVEPVRPVTDQRGSGLRGKRRVPNRELLLPIGILA